MSPQVTLTRAFHEYTEVADVYNEYRTVARIRDALSGGPLQAIFDPRVLDSGLGSQREFGTRLKEMQAMEDRAALAAELRLSAHRHVRVKGTDRSPNIRTFRAALDYAGRHNLRVVPTHAPNFENGVLIDCTCDSKRAWKAKQDGKAFSPCTAIGKHPTPFEWTKVATANLATVAGWWESLNHRLNVSIATGSGSGLFVLDVDGDAGRAALDRLIAEHGSLPQTWTARTGSGGAHFYFKLPVGLDIRNTASALGEHLDIRGEGGQVLAPPSLHRTGHPYAWEAGQAPGEAELASAPDWLLKKAFTATKSRQEKPAEKAPKAAKPTTATKVTARNVNGWQRIADTIGDDTAAGQAGGYDNPIFRTMCSFFATSGPGADASPLKARIQSIVEARGLRDPGRNPAERYDSDEYLDGQIAKARSRIEANPTVHADNDTVAADVDYGDDLFVARGWIRKAVAWKENTVTKSVQVMEEFNPVALKRDETSAGWGLVVGFPSREDDGEQVEVIIDAETLHTDPKRAVGVLNGRGLGVLDTIAAANVLKFVASNRSLPRLTEVSRPGWHRGHQVFVDGLGEVHGETCADRVVLKAGAGFTDGERLGSFDGSKDVLRAVFEAEDQWHWQVAAMAGVAGTVQQLAGVEGGGIGLVGPSGFGKSEGQKVAASFWGSIVPDNGCLVTANATANAMEVPARRATGMSLMLDELKHLLKPKLVHEVEPLLFMLSGGAGKGRMARGGNTNRTTISFDNFAVYSCEHHLNEALKTERQDPGSVNRFPESNISGVRKMTAGDPALVRVQACRNQTGWIGPAFVDALLARGWNTSEGRHLLRRQLDRLVRVIARNRVEYQRAAMRFALLWWCGAAMKRFLGYCR